MDALLDTSPTPTGPAETSSPRSLRLLMCPPTHFDVAYTINPWMDPSRPVDHRRALDQWASLRAAYEAHGHIVETITPEPGLPDMVYAANSALVLDGTAFLAHFLHRERRGEEAFYGRWFADRGYSVVRSRTVNEGEGDFAPAGDTILAGFGFRTSPDAHAEAADLFDRPVVSLELVDPRFYHLDTALCVLDDEQIMYFPPAFSADSRAVLEHRYPDAIRADEEDAVAFGLNATSDGRHVFLPRAAERLGLRLAAAGYEPVPIDLAELLRGGGSVKCCTLELRGPSETIRSEESP